VGVGLGEAERIGLGPTFWSAVEVLPVGTASARVRAPRLSAATTPIRKS
jgi:hypothetical protein